MFGGHPSWEQVVYALLSFYSSSPGRQTELILQATANQSHCVFYRNNIIRLHQKRPSHHCLLASPLLASGPMTELQSLIALSAERSLRQLRKNNLLADNPPPGPDSAEDHSLGELPDNLPELLFPDLAPVPETQLNPKPEQNPGQEKKRKDY